MARVTPDQFAAKWSQRTSAAVDDYRKGIQRVTQAPGAKAAAAKETYRQRTMASVDKWARKVGAVDLSSWQQMAINKGAANIATGVQAAQPKMQQAAAKLLADVDAVAAQVNMMPNQTLDQRIARSVAFQRGMATRSSGQQG